MKKKIRLIVSITFIILSVFCISSLGYHNKEYRQELRDNANWRKYTIKFLLDKYPDYSPQKTQNDR